MGRARPGKECPIRPAFQHDRDKIIHCKSFRRLKHKTQVFLSPEGDHYRTRLTHTLEVSQIARTIARSLFLNEHLTEAIAMGHDLGHTPFGHAGETVLNELCPGGFQQWRQSLRVVDRLEKDGKGLNLTYEVRDGIFKHSKGKGDLFSSDPQYQPHTLEGQVVRLSDIIAYVNHDLDDATRAGVISADNIPTSISAILGTTYSKRLNTMIIDVIHSSLDCELKRISMGDQVHQAILELRTFLYDNLYDNLAVHGDFIKAKKILKELWEYIIDKPQNYFPETKLPDVDDKALSQLTTDFIAGMTDRYALNLYNQIFMPSPWIG